MESSHHEIVNMPLPHYKRPELAHENTMVSEAEKTITPHEDTMNPAALCLAGLAIATMTVGLANTGIAVDFPPVAIGSCLAVAFITNVLAGLLELRAGNSKSNDLILHFFLLFWVEGRSPNVKVLVSYNFISTLSLLSIWGGLGHMLWLLLSLLRHLLVTIRRKLLCCAGNKYSSCRHG